MNLTKGLDREVKGGQAAAAAPSQATPSQAAPPSIDPPPVQSEGNSFDEFLNWFSE